MRLRQRCLPRPQARRDLGDRVAPPAHRGGGDPLAALERGQHPALARGVHPRGAHLRQQLRVGVLDALHELDRFEQLREAVGVQHHRHEIGSAVLVARHEHLRQTRPHLAEPHAQPRHPPPRGLEPDRGRLLPRDRRVELVLRVGHAPRQDRHLARRRPLEPCEVRRRTRQGALVRAAPVDAAAQLPFVRRKGGHRRAGGEDQQQEEADTHGEAAPGGAASPNLAAPPAAREGCKRRCQPPTRRRARPARACARHAWRGAPPRPCRPRWRRPRTRPAIRSAA